MQPDDISLTVGQAASFMVAATGSPAPTYQWQGSNDGGVTWAVVTTGSGGSTTTYSTAATSAADNGSRFRVKVQNGSGSVTSRAATLAVSGTAAPAVIVEQPADQILLEGVPAGLGVVATGTLPLGFQWTCNGAAVPGANGSELSLGLASPIHDGYTCSVTVGNIFGSVTSRDAVLHVTAGPPLIWTPPSPCLVAAGQDAAFSVVAAGTPPLSYQWTKNGSAIAGATAATYAFVAARAEDDGAKLAVTVTNGLGSAASDAALLTVVASLAPSITTQPEDLALSAGESAHFIVGAAGSGPVGYRWRRNGAVIPGATSPTYTIPAVTRDHAGFYDVVVTNAAGQLTSRAAVLAVMLQSVTLGTSGGVVGIDGIQLTIPAGALPGNTVIQIYDAGATPASLGPRPATRAFTVQGLPGGLAAPVEVQLQVTGALTGENLVMLVTPDERFRHFIPAQAANGALVARLPGDKGTLQASSAGKESIAVTSAEPSAWDRFTIWGITGWALEPSPQARFRVYYDSSADTMSCNSATFYQTIGAALDEAYDTYVGLGFTFWPGDFPMTVPVYVFTGDTKDAEGLTLLESTHKPVFWDYNLYVAINQALMTCQNLRYTCYHELMHVATTTATPLKRNQQRDIPVCDDFQDACSTAAESLAADGGLGNARSYFPDVVNQHADLLWNGLGNIGGSGQNKGYSNAAVVRYLMLRPDFGRNRLLANLWSSMDRRNAISTYALVTAFPIAWWNDFVTNFLSGSVYSPSTAFNPVMSMLGAKDNCKLDGSTLSLSESRSYAPYSVRFYMVSLSDLDTAQNLNTRFAFGVGSADPGTSDDDLENVSLQLYIWRSSGIELYTSALAGQPLTLTGSQLDYWKQQHAQTVFAVVVGAIGSPPYLRARKSLSFNAQIMPATTTWSPQQGLPGTEVVVKGRYFGASQSPASYILAHAKQHSTELEATNRVPDITLWSDTEIRFKISDQFPMNSFSVVVNGIKSNSASCYTELAGRVEFDPPVPSPFGDTRVERVVAHPTLEGATEPLRAGWNIYSGRIGHWVYSHDLEPAVDTYPGTSFLGDLRDDWGQIFDLYDGTWDWDWKTKLYNPRSASGDQGAANIGQEVIIPGSGLGAAQDNSYLVLRATRKSNGLVTEANVATFTKWTDSEIRFLMPQDSPCQGLWVVVNNLNSKYWPFKKNLRVQIACSPPSPPTPAGTYAVTCTAAITGGSAPYTYQWWGAGGMQTVASPTFQMKSGDSVSCTVVDDYDQSGQASKLWQ
jgi:hypothetical protein